MMVPRTQSAGAHVPVLLRPVLKALAPIDGATVLDATFGAGGYTRAILAAGARRVIAVDRDPAALDAARGWAAAEPRLSLVEGVFGDLDQLAAAAGEPRLDAVVMDIGVSSMQLDQPVRGFSFMRDGPLDMRMGRDGASASDLVNTAAEQTLTDILRVYGEERAARRIARAIVASRKEAPIETTLQLAAIVAGELPAARPGQMHPATRSFQALRIAVNDELGELVRALAAAERVLAPGGRLAIVTFHSLEDRIAKRFFQLTSATSPGGSRHAPERALAPARFEAPARAVVPDTRETDENPRARSARLRVARRTEAPSIPLDVRALGLRRPQGLGPEYGESTG